MQLVGGARLPRKGEDEHGVGKKLPAISPNETSGVPSELLSSLASCDVRHSHCAPRLHGPRARPRHLRFARWMLDAGNPGYGSGPIRMRRCAIRRSVLRLSSGSLDCPPADPTWPAARRDCIPERSLGRARGHHIRVNVKCDKSDSALLGTREARHCCLERFDRLSRPLPIKPGEHTDNQPERTLRRSH